MSGERLPGLTRGELGQDARSLWDAIVGSGRGNVVGESGSLVGPFNAWLHAPEAGRALSELGAVLRFDTSLERRLTEVAIITVGAAWKAEFEWWAHARMAREHGVAEAVIEAIAAGEMPTFEREDEAIIHAVARQLVTTGRVEQGTYDRASALLGHQGMVELVSLCGYYCLISFILNTFEVALPPGVTGRWS
ncbi:MAG: carboxymuconolactone decarboxylase family protein [Acidimicrobiales bacterium]